MVRRRNARDVHGIVLLDKPAGYSSNQAVQAVRRLFNARKAGHTGTLDPFATGMLPVCLGEASKTAAHMLEASKAYRATAVLGEARTTGDIEGEVIQQQAVPQLDEAAIHAVLAEFIGPVSQVPPMYSALKFEGRPLYELARQGITVERKAREVTIHRLTLLRWQSPVLEFELECSKGTYVRTLAEDISARLGTCGYLKQLRRLWVEPFDAAQMVDLASLEQALERNDTSAVLLPVDAGLPSWPVVRLDEENTARFLHGNPALGGSAPGMCRVQGSDGGLIGLGECGDTGTVRPRRVFVWGGSQPEKPPD